MYIPERYRLVFSWEGLHYEGNDARFTRAGFSGPVIALMARVNDNDHIDLDFTEQNKSSGLFIPHHYYIARLSWAEVSYKSWGIELMNVTLSHHKTGSLRELTDKMRFYIDCSRHEHHTHHKFLVYQAWVINEHGLELK